jgi:hypothetical protein
MARFRLAGRANVPEPVPREAERLSFVSTAAAVLRSLSLVAKAKASIALEAQNHKARREAHGPLKPHFVNH